MQKQDAYSKLPTARYANVLYDIRKSHYVNTVKYCTVYFGYNEIDLFWQITS